MSGRGADGRRAASTRPADEVEPGPTEATPGDGDAGLETPDGARVDAIVTGRVQGVGYRWFVVREATALGLTGWVANEPDGTVRCVAEGDRAALRRLVARLERGPSGARVDRVSPGWGRATGAEIGFAIRPGGHGGD